MFAQDYDNDDAQLPLEGDEQPFLFFFPLLGATTLNNASKNKIDSKIRMTYPLLFMINSKMTKSGDGVNDRLLGLLTCNDSDNPLGDSQEKNHTETKESKVRVQRRG